MWRAIICKARVAPDGSRHSSAQRVGRPSTTHGWWECSTDPPALSVSVATPAEPRGELFFFANLGGEKLLEKCR